MRGEVRGEVGGEEVRCPPSPSSPTPAPHAHEIFYPWIPVAQVIPHEVIPQVTRHATQSPG